MRKIFIVTLLSCVIATTAFAETVMLTQAEIKAATAHSSYESASVTSLSGTWSGNMKVNYITDTEGTDAIGTSHIEHLTEGGFITVTITPDDTSIQMPYQFRCCTNRPSLCEISLQSKELGIGRLKESLVLLIELSAASNVYK